MVLISRNLLLCERCGVRDGAVCRKESQDDEMMLRYMHVLQVLIKQWLLLVREHDDRRLMLDAEEPVRGMHRAYAAFGPATDPCCRGVALTASDSEGAGAQGPTAREAPASQRRARDTPSGGADRRVRVD